MQIFKRNFIVHSFNFSSINQEILTQLEGTMNKTHGLYKTVLNTHIHSLTSSIQGYLICEATIIVQTIQPRENQIIETMVQKYVPNCGIFCLYEELIQVLVPHTRLPATFQSVIEGQILSIKITGVRFQNGQYRVIGIINE